MRSFVNVLCIIVETLFSDTYFLYHIILCKDVCLEFCTVVLWFLLPLDVDFLIIIWLFKETPVTVITLYVHFIVTLAVMNVTWQLYFEEDIIKNLLSRKWVGVSLLEVSWVLKEKHYIFSFFDFLLCACKCPPCVCFKLFWALKTEDT